MNLRLLWLLFLLAGNLALAGAPRPTPNPSLADIPQLGTRERIAYEFKRFEGTTEATGNNDGPLVDEVLASVGLKGSHAPYCAATNRRLYDVSGFLGVGPVSAWSPDWVSQPTWTLKKGGKTPLLGDAAGIFFPSKGRVAHTFLVKEWGKVVWTMEGNTSPMPATGEKDRNGDGFWSKRRSPYQIHSARNWIDRG